MRISRRLMVASFVMVLLPLLLAHAFCYFAAAHLLVQRALDHLESVAAFQKTKVENRLARELENLALISGRTQLRRTLAAFVDDPLPEHRNEMNRMLRDSLYSISSFEEISVLTLDGRVAASTNSAEIGVDHSDAGFFVKGRTGDSAETLLVGERNAPRLFLSGPLALGGKLLGVVVVRSDASSILSVVSDYSGLEDTGETVLARADEQGNALFLAPLRFDPDAALRRTLAREREDAPVVRAVSKAEESIQKGVDYRGETVLAVTRYIENLGWGLVVKMDRAEALAPVATLRRLLMLVALVSIAAVILATVWLERSVAKPLVNLLRSAIKVSGGNPHSARTRVKSTGEIGELAKAFEETARRLESSREQLLAEIDERRRAEEELRRVNRALKTLSECNKALVHATEEPDLLQTVCRILVDVGGYRLAWVGFAEQDEAKTVRPVAQAGYEAGYLDSLDTTWADTERGRAPTATAIREGSPSIARDIPPDLRLTPWASEAKKRGYASSAALPLIAGDQPFGALNINAAEPDAFSADEVKLLSDLSRNLAYGIKALQTRAEHARAVEALRRSEEKYRALIEKTNDIPYSMKADGTVDYIGPQVERYGRSPDSVKSRGFLEFVHPDDRPRVAAALRQTLSSGAEFVTEFRVEDAKGGIHWLEDLGRAQRDESGKIVGIGGILRNVTERRRLEAQLIQSQKMEAIGRLAGGIAHDFNNMTHVIAGYAQRALKDLGEDAPERRNITEIIKAGERAAALTHQLLAFSRKQILQPTVLDLNAVVSESEKMLQRTLGEDINLITVLQPELGRVKADPVQIEQVIMNLALNARDAMPGGGRLTIETADIELGDEYPHDDVAVPAGPYVMLAVTDTGCGMDDSTQSRIFEPFFTTKKSSEGTGLGLSTAYGTVRQSGGVIRVYSEPGKGTTFKIYLPRVKETVRAEPPVQPRQEMLDEGTETILLVEDDEAVRRLIAAELQERGYTVIEACNGSEAILRSKMHDGPLDLVLTDVVLPGRSGREVYEGVLAVRRGVQVLYMSGHTENHIVHRGVLDPGTHFLEKPFTDEQLAAKIREALRRASATAG